MDDKTLELVVENEREWRKYMIQRMDDLDKELSTFKVRVFMFASFFGGASGISVEYLTKLFF